MLFSYKTLCRLANLKNKSIEDVTKAINSIGFEVEEYYKIADVEGVKFCKVLKAYKNPNADRLTVCEVEFANNQKSVIQTTAENMHEGDYVMAFVPGSISGSTVFASKEMKGITSHGMFVGLGELGIKQEGAREDKFEGIFHVDAIDLSLDPVEYFDLNDYMIDVSILSNRADASCYLIFAKELATYFKTSVKTNFKANPNLESDIKITNLTKTNSFSLIEAKNDNLKLSLAEEFLLWKHNIKTFNNAVDLTNFVLLYTAVPCHVYNKDELKSNEFSTELVTEKVTILGNKEVELNNNLVIKNGNDSVSLAATIGFENYQFKATASKAIFELASFDIKEIRKNAKQIKLDTNASARANKEIALGAILLAYNFLSQYLNEYSELINAPKVTKKSILIDNKYITKFAGFNITTTKRYQEILMTLKTLDFKFKSDLSTVTFPTYRYDLNNIQDFVEELFRFYGYDNFPSKQPKITRLLNTEILEPKFNNILKQKGYLNIRTYTLIKPENNVFNPFNFIETFNALDSKNYDHSQIRHSMISSLYTALNYNEKQELKKGSYFEIGMISDKINVLGLVSNEKTFNEIKEDIISLTNQDLEIRKSNLEIFNPNASLEIYKDNKLIGYIAKLHPSFINTDAIFAEIFLDELENKKLEFKNYKHEPLKSRDITIELKQKESLEKVINELKNIKGIYSIKVKDIYQKDENQRNITLSVLLEDWATKKFDLTFNK
ncbi:phenylalanine--tRNA ligase subunit beta [Mycoplasma struthionis]|uniref:phenylalanine--tRNA ligase n=1 Tax=Mycoplasma struthionis TaxID=538220 RepID=A0A3G8LGU3_9MOLU|nr:phenylalanine--tRNA ligase subunit beta [Mycoplasma struthionis]AZG68899.1 phenylalanine--tRNA ligase subunit beta [Mycoplasma struthionis]